MTRPRILIASRNRCTASSLTAYCKAFLSPRTDRHTVETVVFENSAELLDRLNGLSAFEAYETLVVYDSGTDSRRLWDGAGIGIGDRGIGVQLVLQFPEMYFVFLGGDDPTFSESIRFHHVIDVSTLSRLLELINCHGHGFRTLYDPTGLRTFLKAGLASLDSAMDASYSQLFHLRARQPACVIEDEPVFACFNAYAAYRAGFRTFVVTSFSELNRLLPKDGASTSKAPERFNTVITDWDVRFPDYVTGSLDVGVNLQARLSQSDARVFVVTSLKHADIESFLKSLEKAPPLSTKDDRIGARCLAKPYAGIFELINLLHSDLGTESPAVPRPKLERHTAPHGAALIANDLLSRAKRLCSAEERDQQILLQQAVLAGEAKEILGGLSPTTFLDALALQNGAEIRAEASFPGTESDIDPSHRLSTFEGETRCAVSAAARENERQRARLNYLVQELNGFRRIYNSYEEVTAAEMCLQKISKLQRALLRLDRGWSSLLQRLGLGYSDLLTNSGTSVGRLLLSDLVLIISFAILFRLLLAVHPSFTSSHPNWFSVSHSVMSFLELHEYETIIDSADRGGAMTWVFWYRFCLLTEIILAYINQGLLIAMLYRRVTRRAP
jgi:hypothetical protein